MKVTGIIAEYNPFHNGHKYHIEQARALTGADYIIMVMSGNYVQRGEPAIMDKYLRTKMALECGADLVLELPLPYATGSAEYFATGAVSVLDKLGIVDYLCFGSECGDASKLLNVACFLTNEPFEYRELLQNYLMQGLSFPSAQEAALHACTDNETATLLSTPNNRLGIEYCKALLKMDSSITPLSILREGLGYHDETLCEEDSTLYCSASAIRKELIRTADTLSNCCDNALPSAVLTRIPSEIAYITEQEWNKSFPVTVDDFSLLLHYKLLTETKSSLRTYLDMTPDLADKIIKYLPEFTTFSGFCMTLKSKELTYSRISRCLLHILLDIKTFDIDKYIGKENLPGMKEAEKVIPYARILGFRKESTALLHEIKECSSIPMISKLADARKILSKTSYEMLEKEIIAGHIYEAVKMKKFGNKKSIIQNEFTREIIVL